MQSLHATSQRDQLEKHWCACAQEQTQRGGQLSFKRPGAIFETGIQPLQYIHADTQVTPGWCKNHMGLWGPPLWIVSVSFPRKIMCCLSFQHFMSSYTWCWKVPRINQEFRVNWFKLRIEFSVFSSAVLSSLQHFQRTKRRAKRSHSTLFFKLGLCLHHP